MGDELFLGELADRSQHRKPGPSGRSVGDEHRLVHKRVEYVEDGVLVEIIRSGNGAGALKVKSACEHRTAFQHCLFGVVEKVVGPRHRMAQGVVAFQTTPRPDQQPESVIETITHLVYRHRRHP